MSETVYWAIRDIQDDDLTASQQNILFVIASCLGKNGYCWHSLSSLAKISHHSRSQLIRNLKILIHKGYVIKRHQGGKKNNDTNQYKLSELFFSGVKMTPLKKATVSKCNPPSVKMTLHGVSKCDPKKETEEIKEDTKEKETIFLSEIKPNGSPLHQQIINLYHEILHMCRPIKAWTEKRQELLNLRLQEDQDRQSSDWWKQFFKYIAASNFLTGRAKPRNEGDTPFLADLEWIINAENFLKILEGRFN